MLYRKSLFGFIIFALALTLIIPLSSVDAAEVSQLKNDVSQSSYATATIASNLYAGPATSFWITGTVNRFETFPVLGVSADGAWYYVQSTLGEGWIPANAVDVTNAALVPIRDPGTIIYVTGVLLNVRSGPGELAQVLGRLSSGAPLYLIGRSTDGAWLNIRWQYGTAWVAARYTSAGDATPTQAPNTVPVTEDNIIGIVNAAYLNLRSGPGVNYDVLGALRGGEQLPILGRNSDSSWFNVQTVFGNGWVSARYLITRNNFGNAPVTTGTVDQTTLSGPTAIINTGALNIRSGPGAQYTILATTTGGEQFEILARDSSYTWLQIRTATGSGWISRTYVIIRGDISNLVVASAENPAPVTDPSTGTPATAPDATLIGPIAFVATGALNIRTGPNVAFDSLGSVYGGTRMPIIGQSVDRRWWQVDSPYGAGWVNKNYVYIEGDVSNVPVVQ